MVRRGIVQGFGLEAPGDADARDAGIAGGLNIDAAIADHEGTGGGHAGFADEGFDAHGVGLFEIEAIAAVDAKKVGADAEGGEEGRGDDGVLVSTAMCLPCSRKRSRRLADTGIEDGVIEVMLAIKLEEELKRLFDFEPVALAPSARRMRTGAPLPT